MRWNFPGTYFSFQPTQTVPIFVPIFFNFWPPSIGLSLIVSIANEYIFSFSFNKYLYKSMAHIQQSLFHFYLFRSRQHNTSILVASKDELKYPGGSFPKQPKPFIVFATFPTAPRSIFFLFFNSYRSYFIYFSIWSTIFLPLQFKTESINLLVHTTRYVKILHTYSLISYLPFQNILFSKTVWPVTKPPNSRSHPGAPTQPGQATKQYLK